MPILRCPRSAISPRASTATWPELLPGAPASSRRPAPRTPPSFSPLSRRLPSLSASPSCPGELRASRSLPQACGRRWPRSPSAAARGRWCATPPSARLAMPETCSPTTFILRIACSPVPERRCIWPTWTRRTRCSTPRGFPRSRVRPPRLRLPPMAASPTRPMTRGGRRGFKAPAPHPMHPMHRPSASGRRPSRSLSRPSVSTPPSTPSARSTPTLTTPMPRKARTGRTPLILLGGIPAGAPVPPIPPASRRGMLSTATADCRYVSSPLPPQARRWVCGR